MKPRSLILLLFCGCFLVVKATEYKLPHSLHHLRNNKLDPEAAKKYNEDLIKQAWNRKTKVGADPPSFYSDAYNSTITGKTMQTLISNRTIYSFQGFQYATAPRFRPPIPIEGTPWEGDHFDAIHIGPKCPQAPFIGDQPSGVEECLYLNVYTPIHPTNITKKLPVMFFIHGGGFIGGDASYYLPTRLLEYDVILVTIHYRLGAFGFFTLNNEDAPGNIALYDMIEALSWTQTYIEDFGGNKSLVTIFGESAGSVSVNYLMLAETIRGQNYYRAVIAESGSCLDHWGIDEKPLDAAYYIADHVGCGNWTNHTDLFECVSDVPYTALVDAEDSLVMEDRNNGLLGFRGAAPTVQDFEISEEADYELIITKRPKQYFTDNDFEKVPFMTGANKNEGSYVVGIMYKDYLVENGLEFNRTFLQEQMIQAILQGIGISDDTYSLSESLRKLYCPDVDIGNFTEAAPCLIDMTGALFLKAGSWQVSNYHSYYSNESTYYYSFEFVSDDSLFHWLVGNPPFDGGITHSDEMLYIFDLPAVINNDKDNDQQKTVERMVKLWTNFAIYLDPTPKDQEAELAKLEIPIWTPYKFEDHHVLVISNKVWVDKEYSDRWTIEMDEIRGEEVEKCEGDCAKYKDQRTAFMATMITFIVLFVICACLTVYLFLMNKKHKQNAKNPVVKE